MFAPKMMFETYFSMCLLKIKGNYTTLHYLENTTAPLPYCFGRLSREKAISNIRKELARLEYAKTDLLREHHNLFFLTFTQAI